MKKFTLFALCALMLCLPGCKKSTITDDSSDMLANTVWEGSLVNGSSNFDITSFYQVEFFEGKKVKWTSRQSMMTKAFSISQIIFSGTYVTKDNTVQMRLEKVEEENGASFTGDLPMVFSATINGDQMTLQENGVVLTKQTSD